MRIHTGRRVLPVLAVALLISSAGSLLSPVNAQYGDVAQFDVGGLAVPTGIATAPDGSMWFVDRGTPNAVGHLFVDGTFTSTPIGSDTAGPWGVVVAPGGAVWFTERLADAVARFDPDTGVAVQLPLTPLSHPHGITVADGAVWVAERGIGKIARIDLGTHDVTEIDAGAGSQPFGMTTGPDGAVWFTDRANSKIVRYDPASGSFDRYPAGAWSDPRGLAVAPDGTVWFTEWFSGALGRLDPSTGNVAEIPLPDPDGTVLNPTGVTVGPGGIWVVLEATAQIVRYKPRSGAFDAFSLWSGGQPLAVITGPDGNLWVTEPRAGKIARVQAPDTTRPTISISTPADGATYVQGGEVLADYSCADEPGGSGLASCDGTVPNGSPIATSTVGDHTFRVEAADAEGNTRSATVTYTVEKPKPTDKTPPTIAIDVPQDGAAYMVGDSPTAEYSCADDGGSGLATCEGPVPNGATIDTSSPGVFGFTVEASDGAGNTASVTHGYVVFKEWGGKLELPPTLNAVAAGSAVPIWFNLGNSVGAATLRSLATSPTTTAIDCATLVPYGPTTASAVTPTGERSTNGRVMYVWKTDKAWAGTCREFTLGLAAPTSLYLRFP